MMGQLASALAHEINQPLGAIANFASGLVARLQQGAEPATLLDGAEQIAKQALRAAEVLRRLRDFTRKGAPRRELTDLNGLVRDAVSLIEPDVRRHNVDLRLRLATPSPSVLIDGVQVVQVVLNLAINGVEAMNGRGRLSLEGSRQNGHVALAVTDTGHGIPAERRQQVFEPFYSGKPNGTGLGLTIAERIVAAHGGRIEIDSEPGRGTRVTLLFPLAGG